MDQQLLTWKHDDDGLALVVAPDINPVPLPTDSAAWLSSGNSGIELTRDPAADVIALEGEIRRLRAQLAVELDRAERRLMHARTSAAEGAGPWWSLAARRQAHASQEELAAAVQSQEDLAEQFRQASQMLTELRAYVIGLGMEDGLLGEAARGWLRGSIKPTHVTTFYSTEDSSAEEAFVVGDPRRRAALGYPLIGGDVLGWGWRRDPDEDDPDCRAQDRTGPWMLGYVLGEIYATRRSNYLPSEVWLLGRDIPSATAYTLVGETEHRKTEPNSLILIAEAIRKAELAQQAAAAVAEVSDPDVRMSLGAVADQIVTNTRRRR